VHPLSTALLLVGYGLALPLAGRLPAIVQQQQRLAMAGHQAGMMVAMIGWISRGGYVAGAAHAVVMIGVKIWFDHAGRRLDRQQIQRDGLTG
jgi:hypothetical protein